MTERENAEVDQSGGGLGLQMLLVYALLLFVVVGLMLSTYSKLDHPDVYCDKYGEDWTGEWVNESQPPTGESGIVCRSPNGAVVNDTVGEAAYA